MRSLPCLVRWHVKHVKEHEIKLGVQSYLTEKSPVTILQRFTLKMVGDLLVSRFLRLRRIAPFIASFDSLLSRAGLWHLAKGWIVRGRHH